MNKKILIFLMIILSLTINNVNAETYKNGTISFDGLVEGSVGMPAHDNNGKTFDEDVTYFRLYTASNIEMGSPKSLKYSQVTFTYKNDYVDIPDSVGGAFMVYNNTDFIGSGVMYIFKKIEKTSTICDAEVYYEFDDDCNFPPGQHDMRIYSEVIYNYYNNMWAIDDHDAEYPREYSAHQIGIAHNWGATSVYSHASFYGGHTCYYTKTAAFKNEYSLKFTGLTSISNISRVFDGYAGASDFIIRDYNNDIIDNSGYTATSDIYYNIFNQTDKYFLKAQLDDTEYLIYEYTPPEEEEDITPTLTTDKSLYNTSELLTISYTNIDEMDIRGVPALFIVYPIIDDYHDYDAKFMQHLLSSKEDEVFTINTSILQPQTEYYLVIADNTDWSRIESAYITSDVFYVYPDEEYLTTSCTPEGNCYGGNGGYLSIYYKINNNSDIIIKDDEGSIIQIYYNIIDEGEINYHVPFDENKLNSYPNWKIYLNNTEYSTSYSTNVIIYWSLFTTPIPTPVYTVDIPDENVTEQIEQLKEESKPIFDLIYGLTTLVIDNPDYDNDNIVDEHEINNWFNSLIPLGILLLLVVLYMGLKKRN